MQSKINNLKGALIAGTLAVVPMAAFMVSPNFTSAAPNNDICIVASLVGDSNVQSTQGDCSGSNIGPTSSPSASPTPSPTPTPINFNLISWTTQSPGNDSWSAFASSGNGQILYAAKGTIATPMRSVNGGADWQAMSSAGANAYFIAASSKSGATALLASQNGKLKYTTDYGATWTDTTAGAAADGTGYWYSVAISGDGKTAVAGSTNGKMYVSRDGAKTWVDSGLASLGWRGAAISDDGTRIIVGSNSGRTFTSSDKGVTWTVNGTNTNAIVYAEMDSTADGKTVYAIRNLNSLYVSNDYGVTWSAVTSGGVPTSDLRDITVSDDGSKIAIGTGSSGVYTSIDSGVTWKKQTAIPTEPMIGVASSSDGSQILTGGQIVTGVPTSGKMYIGKYGS